MTVIDRFLRQTALTFICAGMLVSTSCTAKAIGPARTYYIDFDGGSDQADGLSQAAAWKHAPGDAKAQANPGRADLRPGDTLVFRAGVSYRGAITLAASGDEGQPITYRGQGFGDGKAIVNGRDLVPVLVKPCAEAAACAAQANQVDLRVVELPSPVSASDQIVINGTMLTLAQAPTLPDSFWYDDLAHYQAFNPGDLKQDGVRMRLRSAFVGKMLGTASVEDLVVHLWGQPNAIASIQAEAYDPALSELTLTEPGFKPYADRDGLFSLVNHPSLIKQPYEFATLNRGSQLVVRAALPLGKSEVEISRRGTAFVLAGHSHVVIEGFEITGFAGGPKDWGSGAAMTSIGAPADDIVFRNNNVHDLTSWAGAGAIHATAVSRLVVEDNLFQRLWRGAGMIIGGASKDITVRGNTFDHVGRTGIAIFGADRVLIDRNRLIGLLAHHGNGISIYLGNHDVLISNNLVKDTTRALTFHGLDTGPDPTPNNLVIQNNVLWAKSEDGSAVQTWGGGGAFVRDVVIEGNVIVVEEGRFALRLHGNDQNLVIQDNLVSGMVIGGTLTSEWVVRNNTFTADNYIVSPPTEVVINKQNRSEARGLKDAKMLISETPTISPQLCKLLGKSKPPGPGSTLNEDRLQWLKPEVRAQLVKGVGPTNLCSS